MTVKDYTLTEDEFYTVLDALDCAEECAVHRDGRAAFRVAQDTLLKQDREREARKITEDVGGDDDAE